MAVHFYSIVRTLARVLAFALLALPFQTVASSPLQGQTAGETEDTLTYNLNPVVVTATRGPRLLASVPHPVSVITRLNIGRELPNTVADLFRTLPGLDVTGVGVNQGRPQIRGVRGQRILLLSDGIRMNNSRRQQDFGELPALVDVTGVERVEVIRGPASVLYGSDAIGGVINVISRVPEVEGLHGTASARYGGVGRLKSGSVRTYGRFGNFTLRAGGTIREADPYTAPSGTFGDITLANDAVVDGTGADDKTFDTRFGYESGGHSFFGKFEGYQSDNSGFGSVDPALYNPGAPAIEITYPMQSFNKVSAGYTGQDLGFALADRFELITYGQDNERELNFHLGPFPVDFGPPFGPGVVEDQSLNTTDIRSYGVRAEARKLASEGLLFTYGLDLWRERAKGTDEGTETCTGCPVFVPPSTTDNRPSLPEATYRSLGAFAQAEVDVTDRLSLVGGARWQHVASETLDTPGLTVTPEQTTDATVVSAVSALFQLTDEVTLVASIGKAFRSPNLIERYFDGEVSEGAAGGAYQVANPDLKPETSLNTDIGLRYRNGPVGLEVFGFRNKIYDGIRSEAQGDSIGRLPRYQSTNVDELSFKGVEVGGDLDVGSGVTVLSSFSWMDTENVNAGDPIGESFSTRVTGTLRYDSPADRFWAAGVVRHNGEQQDAVLEATNPLSILPSFTVVDLRGGVTVWRSESGMTHRLVIGVTNLTNQLYAEFSNASFFRPEPKRNMALSWDVSF